MVDLMTLALCILCFGLYVLWKKSTRDVSLPPGPPTIPFIGNLNMNPDTILENFVEYRKRYGDVFSLIMGSKTMVVVNGLDTLREVFIKHGDVTSDRPDTFMNSIIGKRKGIGSCSGALWKEHRTFTLGALREFGFGKRSLESKVIEEVEVLLEYVKQKRGEPFDIQDLLSVCISNITCSINFGQRYEHSDKFFISLLNRINENVSNANVALIATFLPFVRFIPGDPFGLKRVLNNVAEVNKHLMQIIKHHEETYDEDNMRDYIDVYLKKMKAEEGNPNTTFIGDQLLGTIGELFVAGTETTSTALRWFIVLMIRNPDIQDKMRQEIYDVIGTSRFPTSEDKPHLPYTEAVLNEVLRFGIITPLSMPHGLNNDLYFRGYRIPKDALLIPNLHSVLHDSDIFVDPEEFRPSRFLDAEGKLKDLDKMVAFSLGIASSSGALWKEHRTFTLGALREFGFGKRSLESKVIEEVEVLVQCLQRKHGEPFDVHDLLSVCISNITCCINFGHRYEHSDKFFISLLNRINENLSNANVSLVATFLPFVRFIPGDPFGLKRVLNNAAEVNKHLMQVVKQHEETYDENYMRDYIDVYLKKMKTEEGNPKTTFSGEQLLRAIGELFVAGTETTSTALRWFIVLMIRNPDVQDKMRREIYDVIGTSRFPAIEDKPYLPYTEAVLHEVLRFGVIAPLSVPHGLNNDLDFRGYRIPKDALLIPNLHSVLHDPKVFEDPKEFRPSRFLDAEGKLKDLDKMVAFSLGRRICLGEALARMELFLFASTLIQRFRFLPSKTGKFPSAKGVLGVTLAPEKFTFRAVEV